ncbi:MAG: NAD(P)H-hydrate epimerase, partial [Coriobacteriia bacterium]|nr:NAD(P)H-hydrate epimerase [Coriobacteriia bacterium]
MRYALAADVMRAAEDEAVADGTITIATLMERAGAALADDVMRRVPSGEVVIACGPGNNGGDGWVAARLLRERDRHVRVLAADPSGIHSTEASAAARAALDAGVPWRPLTDADATHTALSEAAVVVDAVFGFGFTGPARDPYASLITAIGHSGATVIAADVPSGVDSDTGGVTGPAVHADVTVTFSALKPGLLIYPGAAHAGEVIIADLGIAHDLLARSGAIEIPEPADLRALLPPTRPDDHKGSRGRVAVVAGSLSYAGAAVLTASGALRMGAGYVYVVVPDSIADVVRAQLPNVIVRPVPSAADGSIAEAGPVLAAVSDADAVVAGPGLTTGAGAAAAVRALVSETGTPLLLDADALNVFAGDVGPLLKRHAPTLVTPHPGEAARLLGMTTERVQAERLSTAAGLT